MLPTTSFTSHQRSINQKISIQLICQKNLVGIFKRFYFTSDSILRQMRYNETHDTIFTTPLTNSLVVPPSQFSSGTEDLLLMADMSLVIPWLAATGIAGTFAFQDPAISANFVPASFQVRGLVTFLEACSSCRVLRRNIRRRVGFDPGLFRVGGVLRRVTAGWRTSGMFVRSFLVGVMGVSSGTTSGIDGLVMGGLLLKSAFGAESVSVEGRRTGTSGWVGSSLFVSSEIVGFVLVGGSGSTASWFLSSFTSSCSLAKLWRWSSLN